MQTEIEAKFLDINPEKFRYLLNEFGAKLEEPERIMRRKNYDFPDRKLEEKRGWVRVRDEGDKVTLSYKQLNDRTINGTKEINVVVSNFEDTCAFLEHIGLKQKSYQETKRESWKLDGVEVEIDTWPWIPTYVELEGKTESKLKKVAELLHLDWSKALHGSVEIAYQAYYNVTDEEIDRWPEYRFSEVPKWLEEKRIR